MEMAWLQHDAEVQLHNSEQNGTGLNIFTREQEAAYLHL